MLMFLISSLLIAAHAETKTCDVAGMTCSNCVEMVTKSICTDAYSVCQVRIKDKKKHVGEIMLVTKDPAAIIDMKHIGVELDKLSYTIASCAAAPSKVRR